jgi:hypothetical protein
MYRDWPEYEAFYLNELAEHPEKTAEILEVYKWLKSEDLKDVSEIKLFQEKTEELTERLLQGEITVSQAEDELNNYCVNLLRDENCEIEFEGVRVMDDTHAAIIDMARDWIIRKKKLETNL